MNEEDIKILEDYIELIKKGYCEDCNELCNIYGTPTYPAKKISETIENLINRNKELKNSLVDMVNQFAYEDNNPKTKGSSLEKLYTGGLSALENAFNTLNIDEGIEREELWKLFQKE